MTAFNVDLGHIEAACFAAVSEHFPHLSLRDVIAPPHQWFDAALARQIALHLMVRQFNLPKRRVVEMQQRSREAVNRALRTIDERLVDRPFASSYGAMAERAHILLIHRIEEAA